MPEGPEVACAAQLDKARCLEIDVLCFVFWQDMRVGNAQGNPHCRAKAGQIR